LEIFEQVLREPTLPEDQFELLKRERIAGLDNSAASRMPWHALPSTPVKPLPQDDVRYVPTLEESLERLHDATYQQVVDLYKNYLGSQSGELTIVGDLTAGQTWQFSRTRSPMESHRTVCPHQPIRFPPDWPVVSMKSIRLTSQCHLCRWNGVSSAR